MKYFLALVFALIFNCFAWAAPNIDITDSVNEESLKLQDLETTDESGCYVTNGSFMSPTISIMVSAYEDPKINNDVVLNIINVAIKNDCDISAPDIAGLSPLNAAILYNNPVLIKLLLKNGANPKNIITSSKKNLGGLNSFQFIDLLIRKDEIKIRNSIKNILNNHNKNM